jgi:predicted nucleic acid-binding protein
MLSLTLNGSTMATSTQVVIDTNVLVALVDARDTLHTQAQAFVRQAQLGVSCRV